MALAQPGLSFRYVQTFGVTEEPYPTDAAHLNGPNGLFIDAADSLYVAEEAGHRLLKYNAAGSNVLIVGHAGLPSHNDDLLAWPRDVALDGAGNIWTLINPALKEFDSSGNLVQIFPATNPWESGNANDRFDDPRGIAFDADGRLYVSDRGNHRVQVYVVSGSAPVYSTTIGVTGQARSDDTGFNQPGQLAFDSLGRLYVMDSGNYRVQRCTYSSGAWTCSTFLGVTGVAGNDLTHLEWADGLSFAAGDVYIADGANLRVLKCSTTGSCTLFAGVTGVSGSDNDHFAWPADAAVNTGGHVFVSDWDNHRIQKFNSSGQYLGTIGVTGEPYEPDLTRLNHPWGVTVAPDGSLYVTENRGYRLLKLSASGAQQWAMGQAGVFGSDNAHLGSWWAGLEGNPAVDASGRIYVPDTGNNRVQIFNPNGTYFATLGSSGNGNGQFECPAGVAVSPANGDIFVVDRCNQRIQVFSSSRVFKTEFGVLHETGSDSAHFNGPWGVAVDGGGNVFVADADNHRVQKCIASGSSYTCSTFAGETGVFGDDFGHLHPIAVAVGADRRVYVADEWNGRVQIFDPTGAYLTTIGGDWGTSSGQMSAVRGVAVDGAGNVYVSDGFNHRIQKYAPGISGWRQVNINGFGDPHNLAAYALQEFGDQLYAGVSNYESGARVWRSVDGNTWAPVSEPGFSLAYTKTNAYILDLGRFAGELYATTGWGDGAGQVWRSADGTSWAQVVDGGFGDASNIAVGTLTTYGNQIYATTHNRDHGLQIWRSTTGDSGSWQPVVSGGFDGDAHDQVACELVEFDSRLYAAVENETDGGEIWSTVNGSEWSLASSGGFGDPRNSQISSLTVLSGYLYAGTRNDATGGQIWRSSNGTTWVPMMLDGFGDFRNFKVETLVAFDGEIYAGTDNSLTGVEFWRSCDGSTWKQINPDGFGDSANDSTLWNSGMIAFRGSLHVGTSNASHGGEVWLLLSKRVYLPLALRN